jgi:4-amino-4-deoxy-L-arabinose transferase-like glycosyltransferase
MTGGLLMKNKYWILILIAVFSLFYFTLIFSGNLLLWDEPVYLGNARNHITTSYFTEEFRFPLLEYFIAFSWLIFGESVLSAQILMVLFSALTLYAFYLVSKLFLKEEHYVLLSTILLAVSPTFIFWSFRIYTDIPSLCFMLFAIFFFLRFLNDKKPYQIFLSGIFTSLSFLMRYSAVLFSFLIISYLLFLLLKKKDLKNIAYYALGNILILSPWMIYNCIIYDNPIGGLMAQSSVINQYTLWQSPLLFLKDIYSELRFSIFLLIPYLYFIFNFKEKKELKHYFLFSLIVLIMIFHLFFVRLKLTRYILMLTPFLSIALIIGLRYLNQRLKFKKHIKTILIVFILLNSLFIANTQINKMIERANCEKDGAVYDSIIYIQNNVPEGKVIVSNSWPWYGYYGNHKAFSLWTQNLTMFTDKHNVSKFVYVMNGGLDIEQEIFDEFDKIYLEKHFEDDCNQEVFVYGVEYP